MAIIWALRSDNSDFNARYSAASLAPSIHYSSVANAAPTYDVDATAIGGNSFNLDRATTTSRNLSYQAKGVFSNTAFSILMRAKLSVAGTLGLIEISPSATFQDNWFAAYTVTNDWRIRLFNETPAAAANGANIYVAAPTLNTWLDLLWTWDGTTTANAVKLWIDGTNVGSLTAAVAQGAKDSSRTEYITLGGISNLITARLRVNEVVIWDSVIDPSAVTLTSGSGALNGASRTAFVDVTTLDGSASAGGSSIVTYSL